MYADQQLKAQLQVQASYENTKCAEPMGTACGQAVGRIPFTLSEEAQRNEQFHYDQAAKAGSAARFLSAHPEFDEFIRLVRAGAIQF